MNAFVHLWLYLAEIYLRKKNVSVESCTENQNTFCFRKCFLSFRKSCSLYEIILKKKKYCRARQLPCVQDT